MCFVINKNCAGELKMTYEIKSKDGDLEKDSPAKIADHVAVHESGVKSVVKTGQGSALVETAMTPQSLKESK
mgnify:CR=1 FL=1|tara:strand:+ start:16935 stop:17150 length:216 start_codon:yes stop_codon:yes gene_type:complete